MITQNYFIVRIIVLGICFNSIQVVSQQSPLKLHTKLNNGGKSQQESVFTPQQWRAVKAIGSLAAAGLIARLGREKKGWFPKVMSASGLALTFGYGLQQDQLIYWGWRGPLVACIGKAIASDCVQRPLANIQIFGPLLSSQKYDYEHREWQPACSSDCAGTCPSCGPLQTVLAMGIYCAFKPYFDRKIEDLQEWLGISSSSTEE